MTRLERARRAHRGAELTYSRMQRRTALAVERLEDARRAKRSWRGALTKREHVLATKHLARMRAAEADALEAKETTEAEFHEADSAEARRLLEAEEKRSHEDQVREEEEELHRLYFGALYD